MPYVISNLGDFVTHRGRRWHLPRGQAVELPPSVAEIALRLPDTQIVHPVQDEQPATRSEVINALGEHDWVLDLIDAGYGSLSSLIEASDQELLDAPGVGPARLEEIRDRVG